MKYQVQITKGWMLGVHTFRRARDAETFITEWRKVSDEADARAIRLWKGERP